MHSAGTRNGVAVGGKVTGYVHLSNGWPLNPIKKGHYRLYTPTKENTGPLKTAESQCTQRDTQRETHKERDGESGICIFPAKYLDNS